MSDSLKRLRHSDLIALTRVFAPYLNEKGVCNGFTPMWIQALLTSKSDEAIFYQRLDDIYAYIKLHPIQHISEEIDAIFQSRNQDSPPFTEEELKKIQIKAFAQSIAIQQAPLHEMFGEHINALHKEKLYPLTTSKKLDDIKAKIFVNPLGLLDPSMPELTAYFKYAESLLKLSENKSPIAFLMCSEFHAVGLTFDHESNQWHFIDINYLYGKKNYYFELSSQALSQKIFTCFEDALHTYTAFSIQAISLSEHTELIGNLKKLTLAAVSLEMRENSRGTNLLFIACLLDNEKAVQLILENKAININKVNKKYLTSLHLVCRDGNIAIVKLLLKHPSMNSLNVPTDKGFTPLHFAIYQSHMDIVKLLLQQPGIYHSINMRNSKGNTPLHLACGRGELDIMKLMLKTANVTITINDSDNEKNTLLHIACSWGHTDILKYLLNHPLLKTLNAPNKDGDTPLHFACLNGHEKIVKLLLKAGAKNSPNLKGETPLSIAQEKNQAKIVALFSQNYLNGMEVEQQLNKNTKRKTDSENLVNTEEKLISKKRKKM